MKIWIVMQGKNHKRWNDWLENLTHWARANVIHVMDKEMMHMAEIKVEYTNINFNNSDSQQNFSHPVVIDGWIDGKFHIYSDGVDSLPDYQRKDLFTALQYEPEKLLCNSYGEFTIACWNETNLGFIVATDIYATRPVYYWISKEKELFIANDIRALLLITEIPFLIDEEICKIFPTSGFAVGENDFEELTFFKGIKKSHQLLLLHGITIHYKLKDIGVCLNCLSNRK